MSTFVRVFIAAIMTLILILSKIVLVNNNTIKSYKWYRILNSICCGIAMFFWMFAIFSPSLFWGPMLFSLIIGMVGFISAYTMNMYNKKETLNTGNYISSFIGREGTINEEEAEGVYLGILDENELIYVYSIDKMEKGCKFKITNITNGKILAEKINN